MSEVIIWFGYPSPSNNFGQAILVWIPEHTHTVNNINNELTKNDVSVLSLIMFYENRRIMMYKVIGLVIYTIIYDYICLKYLGLFSKRYPNMKITLKIPS